MKKLPTNRCTGRDASFGLLDESYIYDGVANRKRQQIRASGRLLIRRHPLKSKKVPQSKNHNDLRSDNTL